MSRFITVIEATNSQNLETFVATHKVDRDLKPATEKQINEMESVLGVKAGKQFKQYLLSYGALSYKFVEFLGISGTEARPKIINDTITLRKYGTGVPVNMIPIYKIHDEGLYAMVDSSDNVYEVDVYHYFKGTARPKKTGLKFNDYVINLFTMADKE